MPYLTKLLHGLSYLPNIIEVVENLFANRGSDEKKTAAMTFLEATLSVGEALSTRQITDEAKFRMGLSKMIDGAVDCLNASAWTKQETVAK